MSSLPVSNLAPFVERASTLPAMPEVANTLIRSFSRDDLSLPEVAGLIGRDQVLAAKVLRLANSPRYAPRHDIASLKDAAATLGLRALRDLTLAACMSGAFPTVIGFDRLSFWRSTLALAAYTQPLARALGLDEDEAYLGGLVLRTGQILMLMTDPEHAVLAQYQALRRIECEYPDRPRLGLAGIGLVTALVMNCMPLLLALYIRLQPAYAEYSLLRGLGRPQRAMVEEILRLGLPIGGTYAVESGMFTVATLCMGIIGDHGRRVNTAGRLRLGIEQVRRLGVRQVRIGHHQRRLQQQFTRLDAAQVEATARGTGGPGTTIVGFSLGGFGLTERRECPPPSTTTLECVPGSTLGGGPLFQLGFDHRF